MRILFYSAFAFFLALTGMVSFYALQSPLNSGGAKIVLSIDTTGMPRDVGSQSGTNDLFAEDELKAPGAKAEASPAVETGGTETAKAGTVPAQTASTETQLARATSSGSSLAPPQEPEQVASRQPAPGTAVATAPQSPEYASEALPIGQPQLGTLKPTQEKPQVVASLERGLTPVAPEKDAGDTAIGKNDNGITNVATVEDGHAPTAVAPSTSLSVKPQSAAQPAVAAPAAPQAASPPLPMRRPSAPPPVRVATAEGWGTSTMNAVAPGAPGGVRVAILLRGIGQDRRDSQEAITKLPGAISFGVLTTDDGEEMAKKAREKGHEIVVQLPTDLETSSSGLDFLSSSAPNDGASRVQAVLGRFKGYAGVTTPASSKLLQSKDSLRPVMMDIKTRNVVFIGEGTNSHALAREMAAELKIRYGNAAVIIDTQPTPDGIKAALGRLVGVAQKKGSAIGIGYVSTETIDQIQAWSQGLAAQGVTLVPAVSLAGPL